MVAPALIPAAFAAAAPFLPAGKALAGYLATSGTSSGLFKALESKLDSYARKEEDMRERVRSRMHVVLHLRPMIPSVKASKTIEAPATPPSTPPSWKRWWSASETEAKGSGQSLSAAAANCTGALLGGLWCVPAKPVESRTSASAVATDLLPGNAKSMDLGEGAERHEMVLAKVDGYIVIDYKGMMYRLLDANGKELPSGLKAFRINVLYDILRGAAQSGEFEADPKQRQSQTMGVPQSSKQLSMANTSTAGNARQLDDVVVPGTPGDARVSRPDLRGLHSSSAMSSLADDAALAANGQDGQIWDEVSFHHPVASGLSEAMEFTKRVRLRAEVLCMRGKDVMFASYFDTDFTRENMLAGTKLHSVGKEDAENPYCKFVQENTAAILAQGEILSAADLKAVCATAGSSSDERQHNENISQCFQSFSRIKDLTGSVGSSMMPWFRQLVDASSPNQDKKKKAS